MGKLLLNMEIFSNQEINFRSPALNRSKSQLSVAKSQDSVPSRHNDFVDDFASDDEFQDDVSIPVPDPPVNYGVSFTKSLDLRF